MCAPLRSAARLTRLPALRGCRSSNRCLTPQHRRSSTAPHSPASPRTKVRYCRHGLYCPYALQSSMQFSYAPRPHAQTLRLRGTEALHRHEVAGLQGQSLHLATKAAQNAGSSKVESFGPLHAPRSRRDCTLARAALPFGSAPLLLLPPRNTLKSASVRTQRGTQPASLCIDQSFRGTVRISED